MSEIHLSEVQIAMIRRAIREGKKCFVTHDLLINIHDAHVTVTNAHTGKEMKILNWGHECV